MASPQARPTTSLTTWFAFTCCVDGAPPDPGACPPARGELCADYPPPAAGVALADFTAMTRSLAGLGALLLTSATLFTALKWVGAAYLVDLLGIKLGVRRRQLPDLGSELRPYRMRCISGHAFVVTALNPKSLAFFVAFVPQFIDHDNRHPAAARDHLGGDLRDACRAERTGLSRSPPTSSPHSVGRRRSSGWPNRTGGLPRRHGGGDRRDQPETDASELFCV